jgi:subtilisin family serine protease
MNPLDGGRLFLRPPWRRRFRPGNLRMSVPTELRTIKMIGEIAPVEAPVQVGDVTGALVGVSALVQAREARSLFQVDGAGLSVAVLDTGLRTSHNDFSGRVRCQVNFTSDNDGDTNNAWDGHGHGTNVTGIIAAGHPVLTGIAPGAGVVPIKVLTNSATGQWSGIEKGLQWVLDNHQHYSVSAVCMSIQDNENHKTDEEFSANLIREKVASLRAARIPVVIASGNNFGAFHSVQGMCAPAIFREAVSVGAAYVAKEDGEMEYSDGSISYSPDVDEVTPFSQRLHPTINDACFTTVFAPGSPVTSAGISSDNGRSTQSGTSQAAPVVAGIILLMQQYYRRVTGDLPATDRLVAWLRGGTKKIVDSEDQNDNVVNTGLEFLRVDALLAVEKVARGLQYETLMSGLNAR